MKRTLRALITAAILAISIVSCTKTEPNYQRVIPANTIGVLSIKAKQLADKAGLSQEMKSKLNDILKNGLQGQNAEKLERIFQNPEESGISMSDPILIFGSIENKQVGLVAKVKKQASLNELFTSLQSEGACSTPEKKDTYSETIIGDNLVCTYDDNSLLILFAADNVAQGQQQAAIYMAQDEKQSIIPNKAFQKAINKGTDFSYFVSLSGYTNAATQYMKMLGGSTLPMMSIIPDSLLWSKIFMIGSLNFEKGKITSEAGYTSDDKDALKKFEDFSPANKQTNAFLNRFPASTIYYTGLNLNGEKLYNIVEPNLSNLPTPVNTDELKKLLSSINGDMAIGITKLGMMGIPSVLFYSEVKDNYPLTFIQEQAKGKIQLIPNGEDAWKINIPMLNMNLFFGIRDKQFYFTNDIDAYNAITEQSANPLGKTPQGAVLKESYACIYLSFSSLMQLPVLDMLFQGMGTQGQALKSELSTIDYLDILNLNKTEAVGNLYLKNKDENSLKVIINEMEKIIPVFNKK